MLIQLKHEEKQSISTNATKGHTGSHYPNENGYTHCLNITIEFTSIYITLNLVQLREQNFLPLYIILNENLLHETPQITTAAKTFFRIFPNPQLILYQKEALKQMAQM